MKGLVNPKNTIEEYCNGRDCSCCEFYYHSENKDDCLAIYSYQKGRADAIKEIKELAHEDVTTGNMIISLANVVDLIDRQPWNDSHDVWKTIQEKLKEEK